MTTIQLTDEELVALSVISQFGIQTLHASMAGNIEYTDDNTHVAIHFRGDYARYFIETSEMAGTMLLGMENPQLDIKELTIEMAFECSKQTLLTATNLSSQLNDLCRRVLDVRLEQAVAAQKDGILKLNHRNDD